MQYKVKGANQDSGKEIMMTLTASSEDSAAEAANDRGILVESITPLPRRMGNWFRDKQPSEPDAPAFRNKHIMQIAKNTTVIAFWVRFWSWLAVAGLIIEVIHLLANGH